MNLKGTKTEKNLLAAFAGESMARTRYNIFSKIAEDQNCHLVAEIFNETARNEFAHATRMFQFLHSIGNTEDNLASAAMGEHEEWSSLYKQSASDAYEEGFNEIGDFFTKIASIEKNHEERFLSLQNLLQNNTMFNGDTSTYWICANCGYIHVGPQPPEYCDVCKYPRGYFSKKQ